MSDSREESARATTAAPCLRLPTPSSRTSNAISPGMSTAPGGLMSLNAIHLVLHAIHDLPPDLRDRRYIRRLCAVLRREGQEVHWDKQEYPYPNPWQSLGAAADRVLRKVSEP
jgi:hypothetical protein